MAAAERIPAARRRSGISLPALAQRAGLPKALLGAYESAGRTPDPETLDWIVTCASFDPCEELEAVLELVEHLPTRHSPTLEYPVFGR